MFEPKTPATFRIILVILVIIAVLVHIIYHLATVPPKLEECNFPPEDVAIEAQE
jgi:hypothetical protein